MNITEYIKSKPELDVLHFPTVYKTITTLIGEGLLSMDDFNKKFKDFHISNKG